MPSTKTAEFPSNKMEGTEGNTTYKVYTRRWYILGTFSLIACMQCLIWNTFGPIDNSIKYAYDWNDSTVAMMANWGTITFIIIVFPFCWIMETKGLRVITIITVVLVALAAVPRAVTTDQLSFLIFAHIGSVWNGFAGAVVMAAPPAISAVWFPPEQRTTATAINQVFNNLGNGLSYFIGPWLVPDKNLTENILNVASDKNEVKSQIQLYMGLDAGICVALLIAVLVYFPAKPPTPPSASASVERTNFSEGLKTIIKDRNVLLCTFGYAMSGGVVGAWQAVMTVNFKPLGVDDETSGMIGVVSCFSSCVVALIIAFFSDKFIWMKKHFKITLVTLLVLQTASFTWLVLICAGIIDFDIDTDLWQLYASTIAGCSFGYALIPLFFEYTAELAYPIDEGLLGGFLTCFNNVFGCIFLFLFFIPMESMAWMNYCLVASSLIPIPLVLLTKESYRRLDVDMPGEPITVGPSEPPYSILEN